MSSLRFATSDSLLSWLKNLAAERRVFAPRKEGPSVVFRRYQASDLNDLSDIAPLLERAVISPKEVIMERGETLVKFSANKDQTDPALLEASLQADCAAEPTVIFGGRPCDARGFVVLDRPYLQGNYPDPYYQARREATLIITQACPSAFPTCFCNWIGGSPSDDTGSDILLTAISGGFALQGVSLKGQELLDASPFPKSSGKQDQVDKAHQVAAQTLPQPSVLRDIPAKVAARFNDEAFWTKQTAKCLACGACTYLCPTCQCFSITDKGSLLDGKRLRSWDTCMSFQFTLEASGHNPRAQKFKRMRQRISHKYSYYPQTYGGEYSCTGCGRCVQSCPVSLDIRQVVYAAVMDADLPAPVFAAVAAPLAAEKAVSESKAKAAPAEAKKPAAKAEAKAPAKPKASPQPKKTEPKE